MKKKKIIADWMKKKAISIHQDTTVKQSTSLMLEKRIGTLPIVDDNNVLVGMTTIQDIVQIFLPDFVSLLSNIDFIKDFGAASAPRNGSLAEVGKLTVVDIMKEPISVETTSDLMRALSVMTKHNIQDLPVTQNGVLVGIASRLDICRGFLSEWVNDKS